MPLIMRGAAVFLGLALLAGCGGGPAPLPIGRTTAYFAVGGVADTIYVDALDRLALRRTELVAPDGRTTAVGSIVVRPAPSDVGAYPGGMLALGTFGGQAPVPGPVGTGLQTRTTLLAVLSNATIALPDPVAYRRGWQKYRIRLRFGDSPDAESREIAGPEPTPPATISAFPP
jgi:hypothetical protein